MADLLKPGGNKLGVMRPLKLKEPKGATPVHTPHFGGLFHTNGAGRTDNINVAVPHNSYVIPADVVSGMGEGNTMAGAKVLDHLSGQASGGPSGGKAPDALNPVSLPGGMTPFAKGGRADQHGKLIPIIVAGGEYHVMPQSVKNVWGKGSMSGGHKVLDKFVKDRRARTIKEMSKLPGPKK